MDTHDSVKGFGHMVVSADGAVYTLVLLGEGRRCMSWQSKTVG